MNYGHRQIELTGVAQQLTHDLGERIVIIDDEHLRLIRETSPRMLRARVPRLYIRRVRIIGELHQHVTAESAAQGVVLDLEIENDPTVRGGPEVDQRAGCRSVRARFAQLSRRRVPPSSSRCAVRG